MNVVARALRHPAGVRRVFPTRQLAFRRTYAANSASPNVNNIIASLKSSTDVPSIRQNCATLTSEIRKSTAETITRADDDGSVLAILQSLAASGQPEDTRAIENILTDLAPYLGVIHSKNLYTSILYSYIENGHIEQAHDFLLAIPHFPPQLTPDIEHIHILLECCADLPMLTSLVAAIQRLKLSPTDQTFVFIFDARARIASSGNLAPALKDVSTLIKNCVAQGLTYDPAVADTLYNIYASKGRFAQASVILEVYQSILDKQTSAVAEASTKPARAAELDSDNEKSRTDAATPVPRATLMYYADALNNALSSGDAKEAIRIYTEAVKAGAAPLDSIIHPFLKAVTRDPTAEETLDRAIEISRKVAIAVVPIPSKRNSVQLPDRPYGPGLAIYHGLIRPLCEAPNVEKYTEVISDLLEEMKTRGLPVTTSVCAAAKIILEMRRTGGFKSAIGVYHDQRSLLNEHGYAAVLKEYCRISFAGDLQLPLVTEFFSIVQDMRLSNVRISNSVYTTFLHTVGLTATRIQSLPGSGEAAQRLIQSTRRVHDFLTLDASITPDAVLWNQLMNTYQRLGCFSEACRLWEVMFLSKRYNQISVNIMLDACGFARNLRVARTMLAKLERANFKIDLRNWNTWVECLCRAGKFDEALDVILVKMRQNGVEPDMQSVRVVLKFAKRLPKEQGDAFCLSVEEGLPHLWKQLPKELRNR